MSTRRAGTVFALVVLACGLSALSFADSQARIVRLSQVDGDVQVDRNTGQGYEKAFVNLPITQGAKLRTGPGARAEVEFENGSTLRITPGTVVEFPGLALHESGGRASSLNLQEGTAYLNFKGDKAEEFSVGFGRQKLALTKPAHLRLEVKDSNATLAVFKGDVEVEGASGPVEVEKKHSATFDLAGTEHFTLANNLEPDPYDDWDKQQDKYHEQYSASASSYAPYTYGISDLNYYGSFYNVPGYGMMWQPYLVGAGWDPFMNGAWMWYPGAGYTWVSAYPWGWTPYRYGSWTYVSTYGGWFWQPGRTWSGWNTAPQIANAPTTFIAPRPPLTPGQTLVVNRGTTMVPAGALQNRMQLRSDSAGLGIPRGSVRNLGKISRQVESAPGANGALRTPAAASAARLPAAVPRSSASRGAPASRAAPAAAGAGPHMSAPSSSHSSAPSAHGAAHK